MTRDRLPVYTPKTDAGMRRIDTELIRINASMELFCRKLGDILPDISLEIYKTSQNATETLDSLASEVPAGLIEITLHALQKCLTEVERQIRENTAGNAFLRQDITALYTRLSAISLRFELFRDLARSLNRQLDTSSIADDKLAEVKQLAGDLIYLSETMLAGVQAMIDNNSSLTDCMQRMEALETAVFRDVQHHMRHGVKDLKDTLNSLVTIFKDLITRSNATKHHIQTIMTALQVHDIVGQDIENVRLALSAMLSRRGIKHQRQAQLFHARACLASAILLDEIAAVVSDHSSLIDDDINAIQHVVSDVNTDKLHLAEFLLLNTHGEATIDAAMTEIAVILQGIADNLWDLVLLRQQVLDHISAIRERLMNLAAASLSVEEILLKLNKALSSHDTTVIKTLMAAAEPVRSEIVGLKAHMLQHWFYTAHDAETLRRLVELMNQGNADVRGKLNDIKNLLIDSLGGINDYTHRCLGSIKRFKHRMERLHRLLERITAIALEFKDFTAVAEDGHASSAAGMGMDCPSDLEDIRLSEILAALTRPHIMTLAKELPPLDRVPDDGLTLF